MEKTIVGSFAVICLTVGVLILSGFAIGAKDNNRFDPDHIYETNENGQTYGSAMYAPSRDKEPDLVLAESLDGVEGYVYTSDLNGDLHNSPDELLAITARNQEIWDNAPVGQVVIARFIPLYAVDGKTVIGKSPITIGFKDSENAEAPGSLIWE